MVKIKKRFELLTEANFINKEKIKKDFNLKELIKLDYNEAYFEPTPLFKNFDFSEQDLQFYPSWKSLKLTKLLSKKFDLPEDCFYVSNGSDAILDVIPELFSSITNGDNVILPELTYNRLNQTCKVKNIEIKSIELDSNGYIDLNKTIEVIDEKSALVYIVNPNMPTGTFYSYAKICDFLDKIPSHILVILDEAYIEFAVGIETSRLEAKKLIERYDNLLITRTFSKIYGLASLRIGYAISRPYILEVFSKACQYLPVSNISQEFACLTLKDDHHYQSIADYINNEKMFLYKELQNLNLNFIKSYGNFVFIYWKNNEVDRLWNYLIKNYGVIIRKVRDLGFRMTIGKHYENLKVIQGIKSFIKKNV